MAKSYKHAALICWVLSILSAVGIVAGIYFKQPLIIIGIMIPVVVYQVYRTEGRFTTFASAAILVVLAVEAFFIIKKPDIDFASLAEKVFGDWGAPFFENFNPLIAGPAVIAFLALFLMRQTRGRYTIWLAIIILITSVGLVYTVDPEFFKNLLSTFFESLRDTGYSYWMRYIR